MKAEDIRKHWNVVGKYPPEMISDFALIEIAAQLAELNANLCSMMTNHHELAVKVFEP